MKKLLILCILALVSCQRENASSQDDEKLTAMNADTETCSACGMVIREQPAPRGQVIHRDGSREFMCSIDDLVQYLDVPSPSGKPRKIFAEVMPDDHKLDDMDTGPQSWAEAAGVFFVIGIDRGGVMGDPALTYRTKDAAEMAAKNFGGKVVTFDQLRENNKE